MLLEIDADGSHIACSLKRRLFKGDVERLSTFGASLIHEAGTEARLARSGRSANQDGGAPVIALALKHGIEIRDATGDALIRDGVVEPHRRARENGETAIVDEERIFVGTVRCAAIFHDAHATG